MSTMIDRVGNFQAEIIDYGLNKYQSGAVAVYLKARITAEWNPETKEWQDWKEYDVEADGFVFVIKKDGTQIKNSIESLIKFAGWDGSFASVTNKTWTTTPCQIVVNEETYENQQQFRISFVNEFDRQPGERGNVTTDDAKLLDAKHGAAMRAIMGNARRTNGAAATNGSRPAAPPVRGAASTQQAAQKADQEAGVGLPF